MTEQKTVAIRAVENGPDIDAVRQLFAEYAASQGFDLCFQCFEAELSGLPGEYAPPTGRLYLAIVDGLPAGCIGLRPIDGDVCEMKRLYVRPEYRGLGLGRKLAQGLIAAAREMEYRVMRLDTLERMTEARALYRSLGFAVTTPYDDNPLPDVEYMALPLSKPQQER